MRLIEIGKVIRTKAPAEPHQLRCGRRLKSMIKKVVAMTSRMKANRMMRRRSALTLRQQHENQDIGGTIKDVPHRGFQGVNRTLAPEICLPSTSTGPPAQKLLCNLQNLRTETNGLFQALCLAQFRIQRWLEITDGVDFVLRSLGNTLG